MLSFFQNLQDYLKRKFCKWLLIVVKDVRAIQGGYLKAYQEAILGPRLDKVEINHWLLLLQIPSKTARCLRDSLAFVLRKFFSVVIDCIS